LSKLYARTKNLSRTADPTSERERESKVSEMSISWSELAQLTHKTQVEQFGWCICEGTNGEGQMADDCPREEASI